MNITRRKLLQVATAALITSSVGVSAYGVLYEPDRPRLVRLDVRVSSLPRAFDGFRIAQLSDFHYDENFSAVPIHRAVDIVNSVKPDLVVLTGDFVTLPLLGYRSLAKKAAANIEPCSHVLSRLQSALGSFAVLGNHDADSDVERIVATLQSQRIVVLRNGSVPFERMGSRIWLSGIDDVLRGRPDLDRTLGTVPRNEFVVLLAHEPDCADLVSRSGVALQLSGHSHGGQIRFPLLGPLYLPPMGRKYPWGLRRIGPLTLYTNPGIGTIRVPVRINCPPEITVFTLRDMGFSRDRQAAL